MKKGGGGLVQGGFSVKFLVRFAYYVYALSLWYIYVKARNMH